MKDLGIKEAQQMINKWFDSIGVRHFNELTNLGQLTEEVGEVARIMIRQYGEQSFKESDTDRDLAEELSDVLFSILCIAEQTNSDMAGAFRRKMEKRMARDKERHQNNHQIQKET